MAHLIIDDSNWQTFVSPQLSRGYEGMWADGCQSPKTFDDLSSVPLIPREQWPDLIADKERNKTRIYDLVTEMDLDCKDQGGTNYCWVNAPTYCCDVIRLKETGQLRQHSPASAGGPIKSFQNRGGWGSQALEYFKVNGMNLTEDWPDNAISRSYYTDQNRTRAKDNVVLEYFKLSSWDEVASCILAGIPTGLGYNWWSHEVTGQDLVVLNGKVELQIRNSWGMGWGDKGHGTLKGSKKYPDDAVAITAMTPI